jgi:rhodanese-related sulfurtransferase
MTPTRRLGVTALGLGLAAAFAGSPYRTRHGRIDVNGTVRAIQDGDDHVDALQLAGWIRARKPGLRVIDIRTPAEYAAGAIPTAENIPLDRLMTRTFAPSDVLVLYSEGGAHAGQAWLLLRAIGVANAWFIAGGMADWREDVMAPVLSPTATAEETRAFADTSDLSRYFGGQPSIGVRSTEESSVAAPTSRRRGC